MAKRITIAGTFTQALGVISTALTVTNNTVESVGHLSSVAHRQTESWDTLHEVHINTVHAQRKAEADKVLAKLQAPALQDKAA